MAGQVCSSCESPIQSGERFCGTCGQPVDLGRPTSSRRRWLYGTVLVVLALGAGVVGYLLFRPDPDTITIVVDPAEPVAINHPSGLTINIPAGALAAQTEVTVRLANDAPPPEDGFGMPGPAWEFKVEGNPLFLEPVELVIPYAESTVPDSRAEGEAFPVYWNGTQWIQAWGEVDEQANTITVATLHNDIWSYVYEVVDWIYADDLNDFVDSITFENPTVVQTARWNRDRRKDVYEAITEELIDQIAEIEALHEEIPERSTTALLGLGSGYALQRLGNLARGATGLRELPMSVIVTLESGGAARVLLDTSVTYFIAETLEANTYGWYLSERAKRDFAKYWEAECILWYLENPNTKTVPRDCAEPLEAYWLRVGRVAATYDPEATAIATATVSPGAGGLADRSLTLTGFTPGAEFRAEMATPTRDVVWLFTETVDEKGVFAEDFSMRDVDPEGVYLVNVQDLSTGEWARTRFSYDASPVDGGGADSGQLTWHTIELPELGGDGDQEVRGITAWNGGFAAVGFDDPGDSASPAVWLSGIEGTQLSLADGKHWERVRDPAFNLGTSVRGASHDVSVINDMLVAVGWRQGASNEMDAAIWNSTDGTSWHLVGGVESTLEREGDQWLHDIATSPDGLVAVGRDGGFAMVVTSPDGVSWRRFHPVPTAGDDILELLSIAWFDGAYIGLGRTGSGVGTWRSSDGISWDPLEEPKTDDRSGRSELVVWGDLLVALGHIVEAGNTWTGMWISKDGWTWEEVSRGQYRTADARFLDAASWGDSLIVVGAVGAPYKEPLGTDPGFWYITTDHDGSEDDGPKPPEEAGETSTAEIVLRDDGLGVVSLGDETDVVIATLTDVLGPPTEDSGWVLDEAYQTFDEGSIYCEQRDVWFPGGINVLFGFDESSYPFLESPDDYVRPSGDPFLWEYYVTGNEFRTRDGLGVGSVIGDFPPTATQDDFWESTVWHNGVRFDFSDVYYEGDSWVFAGEVVAVSAGRYPCQFDGP